MNRAVFLLVILFTYGFAEGQSSLNKSSQQGVVFLYHNDSLKRLDFQTGLMASLWDHQWAVYDSLPVLPDLFRMHAHPQPSVLQTRDTTIISFSGSGVVYTLKRNGSVERLDRTYFSGYNFGALKYFDGTRLWSLGGYGLWKVSDHALYYDSELREWERQIMTPKLPEGYGDGFYSEIAPKKLRMLVSSRHEFDGAQLNLSVLDVDLQNHTYRHVGTPIVHLNLFENQNQQGFSVFNGGWNLVFEGNRMLLAHLLRNELFETTLPNVVARPFDGLSGILVHPDGILIIETASTATNNHVKITNTTIEALIGRPDNRPLGPLYEQPFLHQIKANFKLLGTLLVALGGLGALIIRYRRGRPIAELAFARALTPSQRLLFKHLMLLPEGQFISTHEMNQILSIEDKSWDNQRKIRSTLLQELEEKAMNVLGVPSFIERVASDEDRRIRRFRVKPELRDDLISVLKYV
jgi:hypothetical protein